MQWPVTGRNGAPDAIYKPLEIKHSRFVVELVSRKLWIGISRLLPSHNCLIILLPLYLMT